MSCFSQTLKAMKTINEYALMLGLDEPERDLSASYPVQSRDMMDLSRHLEASGRLDFRPRWSIRLVAEAISKPTLCCTDTPVPRIAEVVRFLHHARCHSFSSLMVRGMVVKKLFCFDCLWLECTNSEVAAVASAQWLSLPFWVQSKRAEALMSDSGGVPALKNPERG